VEPVILVMSLTESPTDVERLASVRAWRGWSYGIDTVVVAAWSFGFAGPVIEGIVIVQSIVPVSPEPRACAAPGASTGTHVKVWQITATLSKYDDSG